MVCRLDNLAANTSATRAHAPAAASAHTDNATPATTIAIYAHNGLNQRVHKGRPDGTAYDYYYNENWQVLEERKDGSTHPYAQYVWDERYIDAPVVRFHDSNTDGTPDDTLYYTTGGRLC